MHLEELKEEQIECSKKIIQQDSFKDFNTIGGVDLTFVKNDNKTLGIGALIVLDKGKNIIHKHIYEDYVNFPYIPGFLSYREFPIINNLIKSSKTLPDIYMIDGNGLLHPRFCGLASYVGIRLDIVSFGVAKSLLIGKIDENKNVVYKDKILAKAVYPKTSKNPIFVSVGHKISLETSLNITYQFLKYRIPEPTRLAHLTLQKFRKGEAF